MRALAHEPIVYGGLQTRRYVSSPSFPQRPARIDPEANRLTTLRCQVLADLLLVDRLGTYNRLIGVKSMSASSLIDLTIEHQKVRTMTAIVILNEAIDVVKVVELPVFLEVMESVRHLHAIFSLDIVHELVVLVIAQCATHVGVLRLGWITCWLFRLWSTCDS